MNPNLLCRPAGPGTYGNPTWASSAEITSMHYHLQLAAFSVSLFPFVLKACSYCVVGSSHELPIMLSWIKRALKSSVQVEGSARHPQSCPGFKRKSSVTIRTCDMGQLGWQREDTVLHWTMKKSHSFSAPPELKALDTQQLHFHFLSGSKEITQIPTPFGNCLLTSCLSTEWEVLTGRVVPLLPTWTNTWQTRSESWRENQV